MNRSYQSERSKAYEYDNHINFHEFKYALAFFNILLLIIEHEVFKLRISSLSMIEFNSSKWYQSNFYVELLKGNVIQIKLYNNNNN